VEGAFFPGETMQHILNSPYGHRPHQIQPSAQTARIVLSAKNFGTHLGISHIGLSVTNLNNVRVLRRAGIDAEGCRAQNAKEVDAFLTQARATSISTGRVPVSHFVINSPSWITPAETAELCSNHPEVTFILQNHTGTAYLSMDGVDVMEKGKKSRLTGIDVIRQCIDLERDRVNFRISANNFRFQEWMVRTFKCPCLFLPNMYDTAAFVDPYPMRRDFGGTIRIGSFGAPRPWKNQLTAAQAAVQLARQLGVNLELYVNGGRPDDSAMIRSRRDLFAGAKDLKLVEVSWENWPEFRRTVGHMHLLLQPSFDETFNVVTADGIAAGVPSVTSSCIEWTPRRWWAETCDPSDLVRVGLYLLNDSYAVEDARTQLKKYVADGLNLWTRYLDSNAQN
jgi:glycosyltransferase involved in cell wall biosynthesis